MTESDPRAETLAGPFAQPNVGWVRNPFWSFTVADQKKAYALLVRISDTGSGSNAFRITGKLVERKDEYSKFDWIGFDTSRENIIISARLDDYREGHSGQPAEAPWAIEYGYEISDVVTPDKLRVMAKYMAAVERKMVDAAEDDGPWKSFGQLVLRFVRALGADGMIQPSPQDSGEYRFVKGGEIVEYVDHMIARWADSRKPKEARV